MTRAQRIIRFTFWMNNIYLVIISALLWGITGKSPLGTGILVTGILCATLGFSDWYLRTHLGVVKTKGLYFIDDEREKSIALRVHNACMMTFIYATIGLILVTFSLMTGWHLTVQSFGNILLVLLLLLLFGTNCQYYFLWHKYDCA